MKSILIALIHAIRRLAHTESGEFLSTRDKSLRLKEYLSGRHG
jgi:hypothetical protein